MVALPEVNQPQADCYPPLDAWLINPKKEKLDTPLDDRGLVDVHGLIRQIKDTVDPSYQWPSTANEHHFYWPRRRYPMDATLAMTPAKKMRELPISKALLPVAFHNWLHEVTEPPPIPPLEVIETRIESWDIALSLFKNARRGIQDYRRGLAGETQVVDEETIAQEIVEEILHNQFNTAKWHRNMDRLRGLPAEFRLVEPDDDPRVMARSLGRFTTRPQLNLVPAVLGDIPVTAAAVT